MPQVGHSHGGWDWLSHLVPCITPLLKPCLSMQDEGVRGIQPSQLSEAIGRRSHRSQHAKENFGVLKGVLLELCPSSVSVPNRGP